MGVPDQWYCTKTVERFHVSVRAYTHPHTCRFSTQAEYFQEIENLVMFTISDIFLVNKNICTFIGE